MKEDVKEFNDIVLHYLKFKDNYIYFNDKNIVNVFKVPQKLNTAYSYAKDSIDNLYPSSYYSTYKYENSNNSFDIDLEHIVPKNAKSFETFNAYINNSIYSESIRYLFTKYYTSENTNENNAIVKKVFLELFSEIAVGIMPLKIKTTFLKI